jgi:hypothetical protein
MIRTAVAAATSAARSTPTARAGRGTGSRDPVGAGILSRVRAVSPAVGPRTDSYPVAVPAGRGPGLVVIARTGASRVALEDPLGADRGPTARTGTRTRVPPSRPGSGSDIANAGAAICGAADDGCAGTATGVAAAGTASAKGAAAGSRAGSPAGGASGASVVGSSGGLLWADASGCAVGVGSGAAAGGSAGGSGATAAGVSAGSGGSGAGSGVARAGNSDWGST